jgi:hypothetical protein
MVIISFLGLYTDAQYSVKILMSSSGGMSTAGQSHWHLVVVLFPDFLLSLSLKIHIANCLQQSYKHLIFLLVYQSPKFFVLFAEQ